MKYILLLGRFLFSSIFILKAFDHFNAKSIAHAASMGVPMPSLLVPVGSLLILLGGLSILFGYKSRCGAWLLVIFLLPTTLMMHPFWKMEGGYAVMMETYCFLKNVSLLGAALMITYFGSGPLSLCCCKKTNCK
ncbi:MAG: DoxX family protein [Simkaniaceae bacterium]|nr:DoxX family protein [Simkaniaceae bacterium]